MEVDITPEHEFIVQACDGIWDVLTNQEVIDFVRARIAQRMQPEIVSLCMCVCMCLFKHCSPHTASSFGATVLDCVVNGPRIDMDIVCIHVWE